MRGIGAPEEAKQKLGDSFTAWPSASAIQVGSLGSCLCVPLGDSLADCRRQPGVHRRTEWTCARGAFASSENAGTGQAGNNCDHGCLSIKVLAGIGAEV